MADLIARAQTALHAGEFDAAFSLAKEARSAAPSLAEPRLIAAMVEAELGPTRRALDELRDVAGGRPDHLMAQLICARYLAAAGHDEEAEAYVGRAEAVWADHPSVIAARVDLVMQRGDRERASELAERGLATHPGHATLVSLYGAVCLATKRPERAIDAMRTALGSLDLERSVRVKLLYTLAKSLDAVGEYDEAFRFVERANAMYPDPPAVPDAEADIERWSGEAVMSLEPIEEPSELPVLIVGMPRSGTTLTERVIASHPRGGCVGESQALREQWSRYGPPASFTPKTLALAARGYLDELSRGANASADRVADKMPSNHRFLGFVSRALPRASVVHCRRDPRDVVLSCFFQNFGGRLSSTCRLDTCAAMHVAVTRLMEHWSATLDLRILDWRYESLVGDPEPHVRRLLEHVGLPFDAACLEPHKSKRAVVTASVSQVRDPIYTTSRARWKNYEKHLGPALEVLGPLVEAYEASG